VRQIPMLWEATGNIWTLNQVSVNSAMQFYSYDLSQKSGIIFFNQDGRDIVLEEAGKEPWAPAGSARGNR